jgi:CRP-like cAMP-binding protein
MPAALHAQVPDLTTNRLLAALPAADLDALRPHLAVVHLGVGDTIYPYGAPIRHAYFPLTGCASIVVAMAGGDMVEAGTVGREGMLGHAALLDADGGPLETLAQVPGDFARLPVAALRDAAPPGSPLYRLLLRYGQALYILAAQSAGCNALHPMAERCARWLLQTQDRAGRDTFLLTHEYLGYMLGVRRPSVTVALGVLQRAGLIAYRRGEITVEDRDGLELAACECYGIITAEYARLLDPPAPRR